LSLRLGRSLSTPRRLAFSLRIPLRWRKRLAFLEVSCSFPLPDPCVSRSCVRTREKNRPPLPGSCWHSISVVTLIVFPIPQICQGVPRGPVHSPPPVDVLSPLQASFCHCKVLSGENRFAPFSFCRVSPLQPPGLPPWQKASLFCSFLPILPQS